MSCNQRLQARIPSLVAGELGAFRSWLLRRHIKTCPECQIEAKRAQDLLSGLATLAVMPTTDALRARVFDQLAALPVAMSSPVESDIAVEAPIRSGQSVSPLRAVWAVSRRNLSPLIALVTVVIVGTATTGYLLGRHDNRPMQQRPTTNWSWYSDLSGRTWRLSGDFEGNVRLESGDSVITTWQTSGANQGRGVIRVTVNGRTYRVLGIGTHEIRDADGKLLGRLKLELGVFPGSGDSHVERVKGTGHLQPRTRAEQARIEAEEARQALELMGFAHMNVSSGRMGQETFSVGRKSISLEIRGDCIFRLTTPTRAKPLDEQIHFDAPYNPVPRSRTVASVPRGSWFPHVSRATRLDVKVTFDGHTLRARRFGKYTIRTDPGNLMLIVEISPVDAAILKQVEQEEIQRFKQMELQQIQISKQMERDKRQQVKH